MRFTAYAGDCVIDAALERPAGVRLTDRLNQPGGLHLTGARLFALDDGRVVKADELDLDLADVLAVEAPSQGGSGQHRIRTRTALIEVVSGPYLITGNLHGPTSADPLQAATRRHRMVPLTEATIAFSFCGQVRSFERAVVIFNRDLAESVRRVTVEASVLDEFGISPVDPRARDLTRELSYGIDEPR